MPVRAPGPTLSRDDMGDERDPGSAPAEPAQAESARGVDRGDRVHAFRHGTVTITWSRRRCIHVGECVFGLPTVFEPGRRPWIDPSKASADAIARVVARCPTGALHCTRTDGVAESVPAANEIIVARDGPLYLRGDVEVLDESGVVRLADTRIALCRCGESRTRPLCDGAHLSARFRETGELRDAQAVTDPGAPDRKLRVHPQPDGPLKIAGRFSLISGDSRTLLSGSGAELCRCGQSRNKPFCDGSHERVGFKSG